jgi:uncharacterized hydrophobic protein (TIGR00271 family)
MKLRASGGDGARAGGKRTRTGNASAPQAPQMVHLRVVAPGETAAAALELLSVSPAACHVVHLPGAARKPDGDLIMCDVAREEASVVVGDLRALGIDESGSIAIEDIDTVLSRTAERAKEAAEDIPFGDEVVWEEVEAHTSEDTELSINFVEFMMIATLIAVVGILLDSPILIVGAMVVGPEFGPIAGFCVALVERRIDLARRSLKALAVGFPLAIVVGILFAYLFRTTGLAEDPRDDNPLTAFIADPDFFSFFIAYLAGTAGILSLTSSKSGALIGVLVSVATIPAAANMAVATAYGDWDELAGASTQLSLNLVALVLGGVARLYVQRRVFEIRRRRHLAALAGRRGSAGAGSAEGRH